MEGKCFSSTKYKSNPHSGGALPWEAACTLAWDGWLPPFFLNAKDSFKNKFAILSVEALAWQGAKA